MNVLQPLRCSASDMDLLMAAIGAALGARRFSRKGRGLLESLSAELIRSIANGSWSEEVADATEQAMDFVNKAHPGHWPLLRLPAGKAKLDLSLPARWAVERILLLSNRCRSIRLFHQVEGLISVCDSRLGALRSLSEGGSVAGPLPDLAGASARVIAGLERCPGDVFFSFPIGSERGGARLLIGDGGRCHLVDRDIPVRPSLRLVHSVAAVPPPGSSGARE